MLEMSFLLVLNQSTRGALERAQAHTQHHAETAATQPEHSWSQRADGALKRLHRQNFCLLCRGIRATSDCVSTNTQQIPRIRRTLAGGDQSAEASLRVMFTCWSNRRTSITASVCGEPHAAVWQVGSAASCWESRWCRDTDGADCLFSTFHTQIQK